MTISLSSRRSKLLKHRKKYCEVDIKAVKVSVSVTMSTMIIIISIIASAVPVQKAELVLPALSRVIQRDT